MVEPPNIRRRFISPARPEESTFPDWQTGQVYNLVTTGLVMSANSFQDASTGQLLFGTYLSGNDWTNFANSLNSSNNTWYDPSTPASFKIVNGKLVNLASWQNAVGTDYTSKWAPSSSSVVSACTAPRPWNPGSASAPHAAGT